MLARLAKDPTAHFLIVGGLLAAGVSAWEERRDYRIVVSPADVERLSGSYVQQFGTAPSDERRQWLIDDYVSREVLYREALRRGLDSDDEVVRRRMVQKLEFLLEGTASEPDPQTLRAFHRANPGRYRDDPRVRFHHFFFADDAGGKARGRAAACIARLRAASYRDARACPLSDTPGFPGPARFERVDRAGLVRVFGDTPLVAAVEKADVGTLPEPLQSAYGWHAVVIEHREPGGTRPFEAVSEQVRGDYLANAMRENRDAAVTELRDRYDVIVAD